MGCEMFQKYSIFRLVMLISLLTVMLPMGTALSNNNRSFPEDCITLNNLLVLPEDVAVFGEVTVTSPEHPLEWDKVPISGWEEARANGIVVISPRPGEYAAQIISSFYKFSSADRAYQALKSAPEPQRNYPVQDGTSLLDKNLIRMLNLRSHIWRSKYTIDEDGMPVYVFYAQFGPYIVDVYIIAFASTVANEIPRDPSIPSSELRRIYTETFARKLAKGVPFRELVDTKNAHSFGQLLLNHIIGKLMEKLADCKSSNQSSSHLSSFGMADPSPTGWVSARASYWIHQRIDGQLCDSLDPNPDCHHLAA